MRRPWSYVFGLISLAMLMAGAASVTAREGTTTTPDHSHTITFIERGMRAVAIDHAGDGPSVGDRYVYRNELVDETGDLIGYSSGSSDIVALGDGGDQSFALYYVVSLAEGTIIVMGEELAGDLNAMMPVVGGTGAYTGATGLVSYEVVEVTGQAWNFEFLTTITLALPG